ncbi:hypothetical protein [Actinophytocola xanthii]|uniref:Uncharacterized protein n=1 Tax=Actinophytocola xanthii TaxID=1912961 RepID=A0A1Q8BRW5_9PSEU|nr:hypothetical protein [Actinophytocola xanthii]OLF04855.1 hypothetical protein BU204_37575 [Actinophytocola xanthii]
MTRDRLNKREIRLLQERTGLPYVEARRLLIAFRDVLDREPHLSTNGFGLAPRMTGKETLAERQEQFRDHRDQLERAADRVIEVHQWLRENIRPIKTPGQGSYGMKHVVENALGQYVSNGELIAAALMAGYPMGKVHGPNTDFGMSKRDVDRARASVRA